MTYSNQFENLLKQLDHEDELLLARTQWLVISQFLLFVAYFCIDKKRLPTSPQRNHHVVISALGITTTAFILGAILATLKVFIQVRSEMFTLVIEHHDLPMRGLPNVGIGAGLLCPILLSLALLFAWTFITFSSTWAAASMTLSGALISLSVIGNAHAPSEPFRFLFTASLFAGIVLFIWANWRGARSMRSTPVR